ncbi:EamA family transporter [Amycolatopsis ultiminotia]|uniref:EamA family transporter n=1 Tax=Amycolatopsis ultiminotia TaxID=543629 RepID=UPI0031E7D6DF
MAVRDRLLAVFVAVLWGLNFIAIHAALGQFPPMFAGALRFALIAVPTLLFIPRPRVKLRYLLGYGLGFGTGQFAFLFVAMDLGMPTGLASLVLQSSAPFTVLLGAALLAERISGRQLAGILLAVAGMTAIAWQQAGQAALVPMLLTLLAALSWAFGNLSMRKAEPENPLHLTLWMSVVPPLPMLALSLGFEGTAGFRSLTTLGTHTGLIGLAGLAYVVVFGTVVGSGVWTTLMRRNPASVVAPFSLLVPVVGLTASFFVLAETPTLVEIIAAVVVIGGVLLGSLRRKPAAVPAEELLPA